MQNTVYECKQNSEDFFSLLTVTLFRFGNYPANGLVTEQPQYSVVVCIFHILQNTEIQLISNDLRLIFTCSLLLASPCIFHLAHITFATTLIITDIVKLRNIATNGYLFIHLSARNIKGFLIFFNSFSSCSIIPCCTCLFLNFTLHSSQIMGCSVL